MSNVEESNDTYSFPRENIRKKNTSSQQMKIILSRAPRNDNRNDSEERSKLKGLEAKRSAIIDLCKCKADSDLEEDSKMLDYSCCSQCENDNSCADIEDIETLDYPNTDLGLVLQDLNTEYENEIFLIKNAEEQVHDKDKETVMNCKGEVLESWINDVCVQNKCLANDMEYINEIEQRANITETKYEQLLHQYVLMKEESLTCQHKLDILELDNISLVKLVSRIRDKGVWDVRGLDITNDTYVTLFGEHNDILGEEVNASIMQENIDKITREFKDKFTEMDRHLNELKNSKNDVDNSLRDKKMTVTKLEVEVQNLSTLLEHYKKESKESKKALNEAQNKFLDVASTTSAASLKTRNEFNSELVKRDQDIKEMLLELRNLKEKLSDAHEENRSYLRETTSFKTELTNQVGEILEAIKADVKCTKNSIQVIMEKQEQQSSSDQVAAYQEKYEKAMSMINCKSELIESLQKQIFSILDDQVKVKNCQNGEIGCPISRVNTESGDTIYAKNVHLSMNRVAENPDILPQTVAQKPELATKKETKGDESFKNPPKCFRVIKDPENYTLRNKAKYTNTIFDKDRAVEQIARENDAKWEMKRAAIPSEVDTFLVGRTTSVSASDKQKMKTNITENKSIDKTPANEKDITTSTVKENKLKTEATFIKNSPLEKRIDIPEGKTRKESSYRRTPAKPCRSLVERKVAQTAIAEKVNNIHEEKKVPKNVPIHDKQHSQEIQCIKSVEHKEIGSVSPNEVSTSLKRCDTFQIIPLAKSRIPVLSKKGNEDSTTQLSTLNNLLEVTMKGSKELLKANPKSSFSLLASHSRKSRNTNTNTASNSKSFEGTKIPTRRGILKSESDKAQTHKLRLGVRFKNFTKIVHSGSSTPSEAATFSKSRTNFSNLSEVDSEHILNKLPKHSAKAAVKKWIAKSSNVCVSDDEKRIEALNSKSCLSTRSSLSLMSRKSLRKHRNSTSSYFTRDPIFNLGDEELALDQKGSELDNFYFAPSSTIPYVHSSGD